MKKINPWRASYGIMIPNWLMLRPEVSIGAKVCYARLAQFAGRRGWCWPKVDTLAKSLLVSSRQASSYLAELKEHRLIDVEPLSNDGRSPNKYSFFDHPWMHEDPDTEQADENVEERDEEFFTSDRRPEESFTSDTKPASAQAGRKLRTEEIHSKETQRRDSGVATPSHTTPAYISPSCTKEDPEPDPLRDDPDPRDEEEDPEPDSGPIPTESAADRMVDANASIQEAILKSRAQREQNLQRLRVREQREQNLKSDGPKSLSRRRLLKRFEEIWLTEMRDRFPGIQFAGWEAKERGQMDQLTEKYSGEVVEHALRYVVRRWDKIQARFLRGKGGMPSLGFLVKLHDVLVPESQRWAELSVVEKEWEDWSKANPNDLYPPDDLKERFTKAQKELEALGMR